MKKIKLPKERYSPIDFFLEERKKFKKVNGIKLTVSAYNRMKQDPYIYQDIEEGNFEKWVGEETTIDGKYYPPLTYLLVKQDDGTAIVLRIEYGDLIFDFGKKCNVKIDY